MKNNVLIITTSPSLSAIISTFPGNNPVFSIHEWLPYCDQFSKGLLSKSRLQAFIETKTSWQVGELADDINSVHFFTFPDLLANQSVRLFAEFTKIKKYKVSCINPISRRSVQACFKKKGFDAAIPATKYELFAKIDQLFHLAQKQQFGRSKKLSVAAARALDFLYRHAMDTPEVKAQQYDLMADLCDTTAQDYTANLITINDKPTTLPDKNYVKAVVIDLKPREFIVQERVKTIWSLAAPLPMNAARLVRHAEARFGYTPAETLEIALSLYKGVDVGQKYVEGLITWPLSNSLELYEDDIIAAREFILNHVGVDYIPQHSVSTVQKSLTGAIRPIKLNKLPRQLGKFLNSDQLNIYTLIWEYFIASQMIPAKIQNQQIHIHAGTDERYLFSINQERVRSRGFLQLSGNFFRESTTWAKWRKGTKLVLKELRFARQQDRPENNISLAQLFEQLANENFPTEICLNAVQELLDKKLCQNPAEHGLEVLPSGAKYRNMLKSSLDIVLQSGFVNRLLFNLEKIDKGKATISTILPDYEKLFVQMQQSNTRRPFNKKCPECGGAVISEKDTVHCENFPFSCHYLYKKSDYSASIRRCKECGSEMVERNGPYGRFMACSAFPKCRYSEPFSLDIQCPMPGCSGNIVERKTKKGAEFYGCSRYPECSFSSWQQPVNMACPECGALYMLLQPGDTDSLKCPECKKKFNIDLSPKIG